MVFTGIVEEQGVVSSLQKVSDLRLWDGSTGEGWKLTVKAKLALVDAYIGCSIAVNGVCLTVTAFDAESFEVGLAPETVRLTNLMDLSVGSAVNLERSMAAEGRNSGHYVQGHVDDCGTITNFAREGDSLWVTIAAEPAVLDFIVQKGYIAVDGTSLTVCKVDRLQGWFNLMLVQHTQQVIIMPQKEIGDRVNLEVDVTGKYAAAATERLGRELQQLRDNQRLANALLASAVAALAVWTFTRK
jgi:riboflavin synthase